MEPEPRCIELKLISCKGLTAFNFFQKLTLYALVFIASDDPKRDLTDEQRQRQRTLTDRDGDGDGGNPEWNHDARFDLGWLSPQDSDVDDLFLRFEFRHDGVILGNKLIGECRVPLADQVRDADGAARFVSYEVRSGEGKPNGIFNFSYRVKGWGTHSSQILEGRISGYPVLDPACAPNQAHVQYPTCEVENTCCYPTVEMPVGSAVYSAAVPPPPPVLSPSHGEYHCYYPPPPPPPPVAYPYPPPPPPVVHAYPAFGPQAHPWPPGPYFERRW
ncbi:hypothetical protein E2542_SST12815 [Spatholobus suberectus]|nr:hypothetical protein E2542_SST12815 [Spatholobus suberectus]